MAKGLFYIESEGIRGSKALDILRVAAAGAAVGQASLEDTTNALTSAIHVYGTTSTGAAGVMATLNAAVGQGKLHMEDLNAALGTKLLPTAKALGISLPQVLAAIDTFTKSGPGAASAATGMTQALLRMEAPTLAGQKALANMGIGSHQLADELLHGGLPEAIGTVAKAYDTLVAAGQTAQANQDIFNAFGGARGGAAALLMVQQYAGYMKTLGSIQKQSSPGTFWASVASEMNQPDAKIHESLVRMGADLIGVGQQIAPLVADVTTGFADMVGAIDSLPGPAKDALEILAVGLGAAGPILWGGSKAVSLFKDLKSTVSAVGSAAQWMAGKFTASAVTSDAALTSTDASLTATGAAAGATAAQVAGIGTAMKVVPIDGAGMAMQSQAEFEAMQASATETSLAVKGIGTSFLGILGPIALVSAAMYELYQHQKTIDRGAQWFSQNVLGQGASPSSITPQQMAGMVASGTTAAQLKELEGMGLTPAMYQLGLKDIAGAQFGPLAPSASTRAAALATTPAGMAANLNGKGVLVLADVLSAVALGVWGVSQITGNRDRFANAADYQAALLLAGGGKSTAATTGAGYKPAPLTLQQQYQLDPTSPKVLTALVAQDRTQLAALEKKRAEGGFVGHGGNVAFVAEAAPLEAQIQAYSKTALTGTDAAATAASKAQAAAEKTATTGADQLKARLTSATAGGAGKPMTAAEVDASDALIAYYKREEKNAALSSLERARFKDLAAAAEKTAAALATKDYDTYVSDKASALKDTLIAVTPPGAAAIVVAPAQLKAYDALEAFYKREETDAKLGSAGHAKYAALATSARANELADVMRDADNYERVVTRDAAALVDRAKVIATKTRELGPEEKALNALITAYNAAAANPNVEPTQRAAYTQKAATAENQLATLRNTYNIPQGLSLEEAKAQATAPGYGQENSIQELHSYQDIKAAAVKALKSGDLAIQGQIAAWDVITQANTEIYNALGTGSIGKLTSASAETITAGFHMSDAARALLIQRIAKEQAGGGRIADYRGVQGIAVPGSPGIPLPPIHTHIWLDGREVATVVTSHQQKEQTYRAVQTRGLHAGRGAI